MVVNNNKKKRISMEDKLKVMLDNWHTFYIEKTKFGTRKDQYSVTLKQPTQIEEVNYFGRMLSRLISKVYKNHKK